MTDDSVSPVRIRPEIAGLAAYAQGTQAQADAFKLSSNENPFDPLPSVVEVLHRTVGVNRYPDSTAGRLRDALAEKYGVPASHVHIGAGSVSILYQLAQAVVGDGDEIVYAWRSFEAYPSMVTVAGATHVRVPVTDDGRHDLAAMAAAITDRTRAVIVCTPNNPTATAVHKEEFDAFLERVPDDVLVILDQAYIEFTTDPDAVDALATDMLEEHPNVVVLRTFSKAYGLAGLRVGYAVGHPRILAAAKSTSIPLSVTAQAEEAGLVSLTVEPELRERIAVIAERRERLVTGLRALGWRVPDAQANFVWLATGDETLDAAAAFDRAGLVIRPFAGDGIRVSVGEEETVDKVLQVAASIVDHLPPGHPARALA